MLRPGDPQTQGGQPACPRGQYCVEGGVPDSGTQVASRQNHEQVFRGQKRFCIGFSGGRSDLSDAVSSGKISIRTSQLATMLMKVAQGQRKVLDEPISAASAMAPAEEVLPGSEGGGEGAESTI